MRFRDFVIFQFLHFGSGRPDPRITRNLIFFVCLRSFSVQREISRSEKGPADSEKGSADFEIGSKISPFLYILGLGQKSTGFANLGFGQTSAGFTKFGVRSNWGPGCMNFEVWSTLGPQVCEHWGAEGTPRSPLPRLYFFPNLVPFFSKTGHQKPAHIPARFLRPKVYFP